MSGRSNQDERLQKLEELQIFAERANETLAEEVRELSRRLGLLEAKLKLMESRIDAAGDEDPD